MKKGLNPKARASSLLGFRPFFSLLKQTRSAKPNGLPRGGLVRWRRRFSAEKRAEIALRRGKWETPLRRLHLIRSFRRSETAIPRGRYHPSHRQADHAPRDRARETHKKKRSENEERACSYIRFQILFSYSLPKQANQRPVFGWVWEGLLTQKPPPNVPLRPAYALPAQPSTLTILCSTIAWMAARASVRY